MRHTRPHKASHPLSSSTLTILTSLLLSSSPCLAFVPGRPRPRTLSAREEVFEYPNEHVILADCTQGEERHLTSQMAYYYNAPTEKPVDVAVVDTIPGQNALWINANTTAHFTDSGIYFAATIGPPVKDGEYAGYGHNGMNGNLIHNFNCWRKYQFNLYTWQDARCSMTYYCNHDERPPNAPNIVVSSTSSPDSSVTPAPGAPVPPSTEDSSNNVTAPTDGQSTTSSTGLSHGGLIGTIVGSVAVVVVGGLVGLWLLLRKRSQHIKDTKKDLDTQETGIHEADDGTGGFGGAGYDDKKGGPGQLEGRQELDAKLHRFEMDTEAHRFEMANNEVAELDGTELVFDTKGLDGDIKPYDGDIKHAYENNGGDYKQPYDIKSGGDVKQRELGGETDVNGVIFDEPKMILGDELKARAIDKAVIRASTGAGSATVSRWTADKKENEEQRQQQERKEEPHRRQETGDEEVPLRAPPTRSQTGWSNWTTDSDVDLAGFPLVLMSPMSPVSPLTPSEPKPPNG